MNSKSIENRLEIWGQEISRARLEKEAERLILSDLIRQEAVSLLEAGVSMSEVGRRGGITAGL